MRAVAKVAVTAPVAVTRGDGQGAQRAAVAATTFMRINVNTVMGVGGLLDVASAMRLLR